jgi:soluble lytic murein transglycosylase-like protein
MRFAIRTNPVFQRSMEAAALVIGVGLLLLAGGPICQAEPVEPARAEVPRAFAPVMAVEAAVVEVPRGVMAIAEDIARRFKVRKGIALSISTEIFAAAESQGIQPALVLAIVAVESHYQTNAVNRQSGAVGLMQVLPRFHQQMVNAVGGDKQLLQIAPNIRVGSQIIAEYLGREGGNLKDALGRYLGVGGADIYFGRVRNLMQHFDQIITNAEPG